VQVHVNVHCFIKVSHSDTRYTFSDVLFISCELMDSVVRSYFMCVWYSNTRYVIKIVVVFHHFLLCQPVHKARPQPVSYFSLLAFSIQDTQSVT